MSAVIALAGNPNCGKTTLFNTLTGARQHISNYPGVTVEKKEGLYKDETGSVHIVDLPGTYSLAAWSLEEVVARNFLTEERPAMVVNIVDASNLERNLYFTVQLLEMGMPLCMALNMMDVAAERGVTVDHDRLSALLDIPVVPTVARKGDGTDDLMKAAREAMADTRPMPLTISYGEETDSVLMDMQQAIIAQDFLTESGPARWIAVKYLEGDQEIRKAGEAMNKSLHDRLVETAEFHSAHLKQTLNLDAESVVSDYRYGYVQSLVQQGVISRRNDRDRIYLSDRIDRVLINRFAGPLILAAVLFAVYRFTFSWSEIPVGWCENFFGWLSGIMDAALPDGLIKSLLISGIIDGVGGVLGFTPLILFMFLFIAFLEDSGYLARVAFMLDRVFRSFGLHGSSVMAFIVSGGIAGGCAVPGVMATRTLKSPKERLATLLTAPFMNCGAKMPVFALLIAAFFTTYEAEMMMLVTLISWMGALLTAKLLRSTVIKGESTPFVMELPPYRLPTFRGLLIHTWERTWQYVKKAGTVILAISILLWAMMTFPRLPSDQTAAFTARANAISGSAGLPAVADVYVDAYRDAYRETRADAELRAISEARLEKIAGAESLERARELALDQLAGQESTAALRHSIAGRIGLMLEPISRLAGFDWRTNIALTGGFAAKEVVVSTLGTAYSMGEVDPEETGGLGERLTSAPGWSPLVAFSLIVFTIFYAPCFVTVVCIGREAGSWKWGVFSMIFNTALAFGLAVLTYQTGIMLGL